MIFKPRIWRPIAITLSAINLAGVGQAAGAAQPWHAGIHAALALLLGLWAARLREAPGGREGLPRMEALEFEVRNLRRELDEAQERLDFAERLLAQHAPTRRVEPER